MNGADGGTGPGRLRLLALAATLVLHALVLFAPAGGEGARGGGAVAADQPLPEVVVYRPAVPPPPPPPPAPPPRAAPPAASEPPPPPPARRPRPEPAVDEAPPAPLPVATPGAVAPMPEPVAAGPLEPVADAAGAPPAGSTAGAASAAPPGEGVPLPAGSAGVSRPKVVPSTQVMPEHPPLARAARKQGRVLLQAVITRKGEVTEVQVLAAEPEGLGFEAAALKAVRQWRYWPARRGKEPVAVYLRVTVEFRLE